MIQAVNYKLKDWWNENSKFEMKWQIKSANQALEQYYINFIYPFDQLFSTYPLMALRSSYISVSLHILNNILKNKQRFRQILRNAEKDFERCQLGLDINYLLQSIPVR